MDKIYLDNAATNKVDDEIVDIIVEDLKENWGNASTPYDFGQHSRLIIEESRKKIAKCIGALPEEIYFTSGASESNAWAIHQKGKTLVSPYEHHDITDNPDTVVVDDDWFIQAINMEDDIFSPIAEETFERNFLVSHMLVQNETGEIFNLNKYADYAHKLHMPFHSDMTQGLGNVKINMHDNYNCVDIATFGSHKVGGPKMLGISYFNKETFPVSKIKPLIYGSQERGVRGGTENLPFIHGSAIAINKACSHIEIKQAHCKILKHILIEKLYQNLIEDDFLIVSPANSVPSTLCLCFKNIEGEVLQMALNDIGIIVGTGSACSSGSLEPSSVLSFMKIPQEYIRGEIRISFSMDNTKEEIVYVADKIKEIYNSFKGG